MLASNIDESKVREISPGKIDPSKTYKGRLALGAKMKFRHYGSGRWAKGKELDGEKREWLHEAAIHDFSPISGRVLAGLVESHNRWLRANKSSEIVKGRNNQKNPHGEVLVNVTDKEAPLFKGDVQRLLLVLSFEETTEPIPEEGPVGQVTAIRNAVMEAAPVMAAAIVEGLKPLIQSMKR